MKAIETCYNGYQFRSRLEARWAIFYDALGIKYRYEMEGFDLDGIRYLPDFWLPEQEYWIEIKGVVPTTSAQEKAQRLAAQSGKNVFIFFGDVWLQDQCANESAYRFDATNNGVVNTGFLWSQCPVCSKLDIVSGGWISFTKCGCLSDCISNLIQKLYQNDRDEHLKKQWDAKFSEFMQGGDSPLLCEAYQIARQARFEYQK